MPVLSIGTVLAAAIALVILVNGISLVILTRSYYRHNFCSFIWRILTLCFISRCIVVAVMETDTYIGRKYRFSSYCFAQVIIFDFFESISITLLTILIIERYFYCCNPIRALNLYNNKYYLYLILFACIIYSTFLAFVPLAGIGTFLVCKGHCKLTNKLHPRRLQNYALLRFLFSILVFVFIACRYAYLTHKKYKVADPNLRTLVKLTTKDKGNAILMFLICMLFIFSWIPYEIVQLMEMFGLPVGSKIFAIVMLFGETSAISIPTLLIYGNENFRVAFKITKRKLAERFNRSRELPRNIVGVATSTYEHRL